MVFVLYTASFQICFWVLKCVYQCFAQYHLIAPLKILNLGGLSLVSCWKSYLFYCPLCYLENVDFQGSCKNGLYLITLNFLVHFCNSSFLFFSFFFDWLTWNYKKIRLWCSQGIVLCSSHLCNFFFSYEFSVRFIY